jgi:hypothetical protein
MTTRRSLALLLLVFALAATACGRTDAPAAPPASTGFDAWADGFAEEWVRASPQMATRTQYFMGAEQDAFDRQLSMIGEWDSPFGGRAMAERAAQARRGLDALGRFDAASLTPTQRTSAAVIRWTLEDVNTLAQFATHRYVFDQFNGLQLDLINTLTQSHQALDPATGDRLRHHPAGSGTLHRVAGTGLRVHDRAAADCGAAGKSPRRARRQVLNQGVPQPRPRDRQRPA